MAIKNVNQSTTARSAFEVFGDLEALQEHLRISQDMAIDQLCDYTTGDVESMERVLERLHFLAGQIPEKLSQMLALNNELYSLWEGPEAV